MDKIQHTQADRHGGNPLAAQARYAFPDGPLLDFSASINPLGLPDGLEECLSAAVADLVHYPDPDCTALRTAHTGYTGMPPEWILPGNGASELLHLWFQAEKPRRVLLTAPSFLEYERAARLAGSETVWYRLPAENGFRPDWNALTEALDALSSNTDAVVFCNPCNPTSVLSRGPEWHAFLAEASRRNLRVLVDEAFIELTAAGTKDSIAPLVPTLPGLSVLRALTKVFALPGLRIGYLLAAPENLAALRDLQIPWSVNTLAQRAGCMLPQAEPFLASTRAWAAEEPHRMAQALNRLPGWQAVRPDANFILSDIRGTGLTAEMLQASLAPHGFLIRNASGFRGLTPYHVRLAVRSRDENDRLLESLQAVILRQSIIHPVAQQSSVIRMPSAAATPSP